MMRRGFFAAFLVLIGLLPFARPAYAQSDILLQLRSGSPAGDRFRVDSAGGVVAKGELGIGIIPQVGCGYRMMWHPQKAAFRAGGTDDGGSCPSWDELNVGYYSWAGGNLTQSSDYATFAFGDQTTATNDYAVAFGASVDVSGVAGFSAGALNNCTASYCVALGYTSTASGTGSVAIGYRTTANANYSVALGHRASAFGFAGAMVMSDQSSTDSLMASATNQFNSRYAGGYRLFTNGAKTTGVSLNAGGSSWNVISDRNRKEDFNALDGETVLLKLRAVPVTKWRYKSEEDRTVRHIGPMAQDWHAAFGLTSDDQSINQGDFDGVNLAGIKALDARTEKQQARIQKLEAENAELKRRLEEIELLIRAYRFEK